MWKASLIGCVLVFGLTLGAGPSTKPATAPASVESPTDLYKALPDELKPHRGKMYSKVTQGQAGQWLTQNFGGATVAFPTMLDKTNVTHDPIKLYGRCWGKDTIAGVSFRDMTTVTFLPSSVADRLKEFAGKNAAFTPVNGKIKEIEFSDAGDNDAGVAQYTIRIQIDADNIAKYQH